MISDGPNVPAKIARYFWTPCQKWSNGKRPFKLAIQIIKIFVITAQIYKFGSLTQDTVEFNNDMQKAIWKSINPNERTSLSTGSEFYRQIYEFRKGIQTLRTDSLASFSWIGNATVDLVHLEVSRSSYTLRNFSDDEPFLRKIPTVENGSISLDFERDEIVVLRIALNISHHDQVISKKTKQDYSVQYNLTMDNSDHSGLADLALTQKTSGSDKRSVSANASLVMDCLTLLFCFVSLMLVIRSLYRAQKLRICFEQWHLQEFSHRPSISDYNEFIDGWYILILISDVLVILGSVFKIDVQTRQFASIEDFQNSCSFLGVGCLLCYCGILRYLGYFKGYNILVLTISHAMPRVVKFLTCALTLYVGYVVCGWLVLGPFNEKFRTLTITSETLFSLLNGDDMFNTYQILKPEGPFVFCQVYLYSFICIFIYMVLSLFISVVMDSYETIKANNGARCHSEGIKKALEKSTENFQPIENTQLDGTDCCIGASLCNMCNFLSTVDDANEDDDQLLLDDTNDNFRS